MRRHGLGCALVVSALMGWATPAQAHEKGRPAPVVTQQMAGPYLVSFWATGEIGTGTTYVVIHPRDGVPFVAPATVRLTLRPASGRDTAVTYTMYPRPVTHGARFTTAVWLEHTDRYAAQITLEGTAGHGVLTASFEAGPTGTFTAPWIMLYAAPFVLVAGLWIRARSLRRSRPALVLATPPSL